MASVQKTVYFQCPRAQWISSPKLRWAPAGWNLGLDYISETRMGTGKVESRGRLGYLKNFLDRKKKS